MKGEMLMNNNTGNVGKNKNSKEEKDMMKNKLILGQDQYYDLDCYKTKVNNNVLVVGAAGSGKTRGLVIPNILQASGSYVISDPKGQLYREYGPYLKQRGYDIKLLDLIEPSRSTCYNFLEYIETERDIIKGAKMLNSVVPCSIAADPFWDDTSEMLLSALIAYLVKYRPKSERTIESLMKLSRAAEIDENNSCAKSPLDKIFEEVRKRDPKSFAYKQYEKFRAGAGKTLKSIIISMNTRFKNLDFDEINKMTAVDNMDIASIGTRKTAVFVIVSDMERSMDALANLFYSQALDVLCRHADSEWGGKLPYDVRFILDDFATNCVIADFPKKISAFRSRGISAMIILQAEPQLEACYPREGNIVIGNCDNYLYLGGNDLETAESVARRVNVPTTEILNMPVGKCWIIRRGQEPVYGSLVDPDPMIKEAFERNNVIRKNVNVQAR